MSLSSAHPAVTAVIPAYNMAQFVGRAIESALAQTYPALRIIVVDDGSTDDTRAIAERFAARDDRLRVVSVANGGVAAARNLGTEMAETPYVAYLDADDLWHSDKIARQVAALAKHDHESDWVGCYALSRFIDPADRVLGNGPSAEARGDFFEPHLYRNHLGNGSCLLVRREIALAVGGFDPEPARQGLGGLEDYDFQLRLLRRYKLEVVREFLVGYRVYPGQMSDDSVRMALARVMTIEAILQDCDLSHDQRSRVMAHARIVAAYRKLRAHAWLSGTSDLLSAIVRAPSDGLEVLHELASGFLRKSRHRGGSETAAALPAFADLAAADGVSEVDDIHLRPRTRIAALRSRSAPSVGSGQAPTEPVTGASAKFLEMNSRP